MSKLSSDPVIHSKGQNDFFDWLVEGRMQLRKGERTRRDLVVTCAKLLSVEPFDVLTVSVLCQAAGVAHGTFYIYFENLNTVSAEVIGLFVDFVQMEMRAAAHRSGDAMRNTTQAYMRLFEENPGLMKCLVTGVDNFPEARVAFQRLNNEWARTVVQAWRRNEASADRSEEDLMRRAYALGGMVDQYLIALFVTDDPWVRSLSKNREELLDMFSSIWKRGMEP
ncbi:TetR/AcrR family transcriptional regulator [Pararhodobacter oceanensis]|uniref:TetR/AcrR family transcriptional regulator n=1 Tax=Pararhodobacter oceanensis TaxID=2172121 RepID=A0A2T8HP89_9RHOB|nr:TetR/AcrR family transcriptional regulator [Pararhodobacter oceanensis]PVH27255.1 TetR/AcrR family transcriptional regulator [Pararhodobacter oceanensis]